MRRRLMSRSTVVVAATMRFPLSTWSGRKRCPILAQEQIGVDLAPDENGYRTIFGLGANEHLFNSVGFTIGSGGSDMITLFTNTNPSVRAFTVGQLCEAIQRAPLSTSPLAD